MSNLRIATLLVGALFVVGGCNTGRKGGHGNGNCASSCNNCDTSGHCLDCTPGQPTCGGNDVHSCNSDGTIGPLKMACTNGMSCVSGVCGSPCAAAGASHSYEGCDYWPVTLSNRFLNPDFDFAVAVANPASNADGTSGSSAVVTVTRGGQTVATKTVAAGSTEVIMLPWVFDLSQNQDPSTSAMGNAQSVLSPKGAYHMTSTLPITAYQFNPLEFEKPSTSSCQDPLGADPSFCHSYTNDATLLLPTTALKTEYYVMAHQTVSAGSSGGFGGGATALQGFMAVVGTVDGTQVTVHYSANTEPSSSVPGQTAGSSHTYTLNAGDVLEVATKGDAGPCAQMDSDSELSYCDLGNPYDLTGTHVTSTQPVAVFGGSDCAYVPYNRQACDHLETQLFPVDAWGQNIILVQTEPQATGEPNVFRILSASPNNAISFDPPSVHAPINIGTGEWVEVMAQGGFGIKASGKVSVGQYMVGENFTDPTGMGPGVGDPSLGQGVPVEQYRDNYDFYVPETYTKSYLSVIAPMGASMMVDGKAWGSSPTAIGGTGFGYLRAPITAGAHHVASSGQQHFGITVSGVAPYTSYLYVGGQNINDVPVQ